MAHGQLLGLVPGPPHGPDDADREVAALPRCPACAAADVHPLDGGSASVSLAGIHPLVRYAPTGLAGSYRCGACEAGWYQSGEQEPLLWARPWHLTAVTDQSPVVEGRPGTATAIFDLDGTLCDVRPARHHLPNYHAFHEASLDCQPHGWVVEDLRHLRQLGLHVVIVTGRPYRYRHLSLVWLAEHGIPYDDVLLRPDDDHRADALVKAALLGRMRSEGCVPVVSYDDRPSVVTMWRTEGIPVRVVDGWYADGE